MKQGSSLNLCAITPQHPIGEKIVVHLSLLHSALPKFP